MTVLTSGRLPVRLTTLVGRDGEVAGVTRALAGSRLLTLTGPGGTGKTRLALAAAQAVATSREKAVVWVELAPVSDAGLVAATVAVRLGVPETPGQDPADAIAEHIGDQAVLMVLDNCEHVADPVADLVTRLLERCPAGAVLATSREQLGVEGERSWRVPPLRGAVAVELFEDRARLVAPAFTVSAANRDLVWQVCDRLDRLPLAIELAAARLQVLSVRQLAERISDVFGVLTGGARSAPARHQTLRATLDWSHDLLTPAERAVFRRLAVFTGGFTLAAAEQVAADADTPSWSVLDLLARLADKSLLRVEAERYHFLSVIREYAREQLAAAGEEEQAGRAHLDYFTDHAEELGAALDGAVAGELEATLDRLDAERPNFRVALEYARRACDQVAALRIAGALSRYAYLRGHYAEVRQWLDDAVTLGAPSAGSSPAGSAEKPGGPAGSAGFPREGGVRGSPPETGGSWGVAPPASTVPFETGAFPMMPAETAGSRADPHAALRARALLGSGRLAHLQCDYGPATGRLDAALALYRELGDSAGTAATLQSLGSVAREQGEYARSAELHAAGLEMARAAGDKRAEAGARDLLGFASWLQGDLDRAGAECRAALAIFRDLKDTGGVSGVLLSLGVIARYSGDLATAGPLLAESLALAESIGFREGIAWCLEQQALLALSQPAVGGAVGSPDVASAARLLRRSYVIHSELRDRWRMTSVLEDLAAVCARTGAAGAMTRAARLLGAAQALRDSIGTAIAPVELPLHEETIGAVRRVLGPAGFGAAWQQGLLAADLDAVLAGGATPQDPPVSGGDPLTPPSRGNPAEPAGPPGFPADQAGDAPGPPGPPTYRAGDASPPPGFPADQAEAGAPVAATAAGGGTTAQAGGPDGRVAAKGGGTDLAASPKGRGAARGRDVLGQGKMAVPSPRAVLAPAGLRVRALGTAIVEVGGVALAAADWGYAKPRELVFLLVTSTPLTREQIGAALWPDLSRQQLGNALHTALREVRRALGHPDWVVYASGRYAFNRELPLECDVDEFESAMSEAGRARSAAAALPFLQRALAAYGGDFLAGLACGEWGLARREELRRRYESALLAAGRLQAATGRHQAAAGAFRRAIEHEPLNETAHRELMTCWEALGETARAVQHYQELAALLRDRVGVAPAAETTALYQRLAGSGVGGSP